MPSTRTETLEDTIGQVIRELRKNANLSQDALADRADLHRTYVSMLERGLRNPSLEVLLALARALSMSGAELVAAVEARRAGQTAGKIAEPIEDLGATVSALSHRRTGR